MSDDDRESGWTRAAGIGGLVFAGCVLTANALRGEPPLADATAAEVLRYYTEHAGALELSRAVYGLDVPFLLLFAVGTYGRLAATRRAEPLARVGMTMTMVMVATFGMMLVLDVTLAACAAELAAQDASTLLLWRMHTAVMIVNGVVMASALGFFSAAALRAGVGPRWLAWLGIGGAACGYLGAAPIQAAVSGSLVLLLGLATFLAWLVFVIGTSIGHLRARRVERVAALAAT